VSDADLIRALVVGVPARNEESRIVACVASVVAAVSALDRNLTVAIVVASDDSTDSTDVLLGTISRCEPSVHMVRGNWRSAGGTRRAAVDHGLALLAAAGFTAMNSTWIATTDADTVVSPDWLLRHLHHAESGYDAVAGIVGITDDEDCTAELLATFTELYTLERETHPHVHGANFGVRASAYLAADGFPDIRVSEDHALWNELRRQKFRLVSRVDVRVSTSARLRGRAVGGFADTMAAALSSTAGPTEVAS